jgi:hypothetical protein
MDIGSEMPDDRLYCVQIMMKRVLKIVPLLVIVLAVLSACAGVGGDNAAPTDSATPTTTPQLLTDTPPLLQPGRTAAADGRFVVHHVYESMAGFARAVQDDPLADPWLLFEDEVMFPYRFFFEDYLRVRPNGVNDSRQIWETWVQNVDPLELEEQAEILADARDEWEETIIDSLERIDEFLPGLQVEVYVVVAPPDQPEAGRAIGPSKIGIFFNDVRGGPSLRGEIFRWQYCLPALVAHEIHHAVRSARGAGSPTLADALATEGLAEAFAQQLFPDLHDSCAPSLSTVREREVWAEMQPLLGSGNPGLYERFFTRGIVGYPVGYNIVQSYLALHPDESAASLVDISGRELIAASGYDP